MASSYDTDFYAWTQHQRAALAEGHVTELDLANLAEEIDSLGKRDRREIKSNLIVVLIHLLKWTYQSEMRETGHSWESSIIEHRRRVLESLRDSPSLRPYLAESFADAYTYARKQASAQTGLSLETFPRDCPWSLEPVLDDTFWPEQ